MNSVYLSAPWKLFCSTCHRIPFLFRLPRTWLFIINPAVVYRKAEDAYTTGAPRPCFQSLVESEMLIYICYFVCTVLVISGTWYFCCVCLFSVFVPGLHYFFSARILVPLITLSEQLILLNCFHYNFCIYM